MQPYFFPYIGYYQLVAAVDEFVSLDDVNFIKKGYIHRNSVLVDGKAQRFTLPVVDVSQNRAIGAHDYVGDWQPFMDLLARAYRYAPHFESVNALVHACLRDGGANVARTNELSIARTMDYLGIRAALSRASVLDPEHVHRGQDRILDLCGRCDAEIYVNAPGGKTLYNSEDFRARGVVLQFMEPTLLAYPQLVDGFVGHLSMIDVLMWNDPANARKLVQVHARVH